MQVYEDIGAHVFWVGGTISFSCIRSCAVGGLGLRLGLQYGINDGENISQEMILICVFVYDRRLGFLPFCRKTLKVVGFVRRRMGMQAPVAVAPEDESAFAVSGRPSIVIMGPCNVGKHSILKRMSNVQKLKFSCREILHTWRVCCRIEWKLPQCWEIFVS